MEIPDRDFMSDSIVILSDLPIYAISKLIESSMRYIQLLNWLVS